MSASTEVTSSTWVVTQQAGITSVHSIGIDLLPPTMEANNKLTGGELCQKEIYSTTNKSKS